VRAWARVFRYGASPGAAEALDRMNKAIDVREVLGAAAEAAAAMVRSPAQAMTAAAR